MVQPAVVWERLPRGRRRAAARYGVQYFGELPSAQGLYTAIIAGFCISLLGSRRYQIGGQTDAFIVIIFGIVLKHWSAGLAATTVLVALMLVATGLAGIGRFIKYIPYPITTGFTTGIGVLIFSQQVKDFFGFRMADDSPEFLGEWSGYLSHLTTLDPATLAVGADTLALIVAVRRFFRACRAQSSACS